MNADLPEQLHDIAVRSPIKAPSRSRLAPFRESVVLLLAKRHTHGAIAALFRSQGIQINRTAVTEFCRDHCPAAEVARVRRRLSSAEPGSSTAAATAGVPTSSPINTHAPTQKRGPRIARDDL
jgi:hypothetical protein